MFFSLFFLEMSVILKQNRKSKSRKISIEDSGIAIYQVLNLRN